MNFLLLTLFAFFFAVQASPLLFAPRTKLDVFTPNIITPNKSTTWCIGQTESVTWYVIPSSQKVLITEIPMIQGKLTMPPPISRTLLPYTWHTRIQVRVISVFCRSLLLTFSHFAVTSTWILLARDFDLLSGSQDVVVPTTITPGQYNIVGESAHETPIIF